MNDRLRPAKLTRGLLLVVTLAATGSAMAQEPATPAPIATTIDGSGDGIVDAGVYRNTRLNVRADIPPGYSVKQLQRGNIVQIALEHAGHGSFMFWPHPPRDEMTEYYAQSLDGMLLDISDHVDHPRRDVTTVFGPGWTRSWTQKPRYFHVRLSVLPACGGKASLLLVGWARNKATRAALDAWVRSFQPIDGSREADECRNVPPPK